MRCSVAEAIGRQVACADCFAQAMVINALPRSCSTGSRDRKEVRVIPTAFKDHFSAGSENYAASRPDYPPELAAFLAEASPARGLAVDCGCGTGQLTVRLAEHFNEVLATDASARQIAAAAPHPRVTYRTAPAEASGLEPDLADLIVAAQAAHWFDIEAFYAEARRIARPGALLALVTYGVFHVE